MPQAKAAGGGAPCGAKPHGHVHALRLKVGWQMGGRQICLRRTGSVANEVRRGSITDRDHKEASRDRMVAACAGCRAPIPRKAKFCGRCGRDKVAREQRKYCGACGGLVNPRTEAFCTKCGVMVTKVRSARAPPEPEQMQRGDRQRRVSYEAPAREERLCVQRYADSVVGTAVAGGGGPARLAAGGAAVAQGNTAPTPAVATPPQEPKTPGAPLTASRALWASPMSFSGRAGSPSPGFQDALQDSMQQHGGTSPLAHSHSHNTPHRPPAPPPKGHARSTSAMVRSTSGRRARLSMSASTPKSPALDASVLQSVSTAQHASGTGAEAVGVLARNASMRRPPKPRRRKTKMKRPAQLVLPSEPPTQESTPEVPPMAPSPPQGDEPRSAAVRLDTHSPTHSPALNLRSPSASSAGPRASPTHTLWTTSDDNSPDSSSRHRRAWGVGAPATRDSTESSDDHNASASSSSPRSLAMRKPSPKSSVASRTAENTPKGSDDKRSVSSRDGRSAASVGSRQHLRRGRRVASKAVTAPTSREPTPRGGHSAAISLFDESSTDNASDTTPDTLLTFGGPSPPPTGRQSRAALHARTRRAAVPAPPLPPKVPPKLDPRQLRLERIRRMRSMRRAYIESHSPPKADSHGFCPIQSLAEKLRCRGRGPVDTVAFAMQPVRRLQLRLERGGQYKRQRRRGRVEMSTSEDDDDDNNNEAVSSAGGCSASDASVGRRREGAEAGGLSLAAAERLQRNLQLSHFLLERYGPVVRGGGDGSGDALGTSWVHPVSPADHALDRVSTASDEPHKATSSQGPASDGVHTTPEANPTALFANILARFEAMAQPTPGLTASMSQRHSEKGRKAKAGRRRRRRRRPRGGASPEPEVTGRMDLFGRPLTPPPAEVTVLKKREDANIWQQRLRPETEHEHTDERAATSVDEESAESVSDSDWGDFRYVEGGGGDLNSSRGGGGRSPSAQRRGRRADTAQSFTADGASHSSGSESEEREPAPQEAAAAREDSRAAQRSERSQSPQSVALSLTPTISPASSPSKARVMLEHVPPAAGPGNRGGTSPSKAPTLAASMRRRGGKGTGKQAPPKTPLQGSGKRGAKRSAFTRGNASVRRLSAVASGTSDDMLEGHRTVTSDTEHTSGSLKKSRSGGRAAGVRSPTQRCVSFKVPKTIVVTEWAGVAAGAPHGVLSPLGDSSAAVFETDELSGSASTSGDDSNGTSTPPTAAAAAAAPHADDTPSATQHAAAADDRAEAEAIEARGDGDPAAPFILDRVDARVQRNMRRTKRRGLDGEGGRAHGSDSGGAATPRDGDNADGVSFDNLRAVVDPDVTVGFDGAAEPAPTARPSFKGLSKAAVLGGFVGEASPPRRPASPPGSAGGGSASMSVVGSCVSLRGSLASMLPRLRGQVSTGAGDADVPVRPESLRSDASVPGRPPIPAASASPRRSGGGASGGGASDDVGCGDSASPLSRRSQGASQIRSEGCGSARTGPTQHDSSDALFGDVDALASCIRRRKHRRKTRGRGGKARAAGQSTPTCGSPESHTLATTSPTSESAPFGGLGSVFGSMSSLLSRPHEAREVYEHLGVQDMASMWAGLRPKPPPLRAEHFRDDEEDDVAQRLTQRGRWQPPTGDDLDDARLALIAALDPTIPRPIPRYAVRRRRELPPLVYEEALDNGGLFHHLPDPLPTPPDSPVAAAAAAATPHAAAGPEGGEAPRSQRRKASQSRRQSQATPRDRARRSGGGVSPQSTGKGAVRRAKRSVFDADVAARQVAGSAVGGESDGDSTHSGGGGARPSLKQKARGGAEGGAGAGAGAGKERRPPGSAPGSRHMTPRHSLRDSGSSHRSSRPPSPALTTTPRTVPLGASPAPVPPGGIASPVVGPPPRSPPTRSRGASTVGSATATPVASPPATVPMGAVRHAPEGAASPVVPLAGGHAHAHSPGAEDEAAPPMQPSPLGAVMTASGGGDCDAARDAFPATSLEQLSQMAGAADLPVHVRGVQRGSGGDTGSRSRRSSSVRAASPWSTWSRATSPGVGGGGGVRAATPDLGGRHPRQRRQSVGFHGASGSGFTASTRRPSSDITGMMSAGRRKSELQLHHRRRSSSKVTIIGPRAKRPSLYDPLYAGADSPPYDVASSPLSHASLYADLLCSGLEGDSVVFDTLDAPIVPLPEEGNSPLMGFADEEVRMVMQRAPQAAPLDAAAGEGKGTPERHVRGARKRSSTQKAVSRRRRPSMSRPVSSASAGAARMPRRPNSAASHRRPSSAAGGARSPEPTGPQRRGHNGGGGGGDDADAEEPATAEATHVDLLTLLPRQEGVEAAIVQEMHAMHQRQQRQQANAGADAGSDGAGGDAGGLGGADGDNFDRQAAATLDDVALSI